MEYSNIYLTKNMKIKVLCRGLLCFNCNMNKAQLLENKQNQFWYVKNRHCAPVDMPDKINYRCRY